MKKLLKVIANKILDAFNECGEYIAEGIENGNWVQVVVNSVIIFGMGILCVAGLVSALYCWPIILCIIIVVWFIQSLLGNSNNESAADASTSNDVDIALIRQRALDMQGYVLSFILRVLIAISSITPVIRPHTTQDISISAVDGASFYMDKDGNVIYHVEVEVEGEVTQEVEDLVQRECQRYALKYITDYPMLISPEAGGRAAVEILRAKNGGDRVIIDFVFTTAKAIPMIDACRRARVERQMRRERPATYTDPDYGE